MIRRRQSGGQLIRRHHRQAFVPARAAAHRGDPHFEGR
jgi:hypothetical protein